MADYDEEYMAQVEEIRAARKIQVAVAEPEPTVEEEAEAVQPATSLIPYPKDSGGGNPS